MENAPKKWNLLKNQVKHAIIKFINQMVTLIADCMNQKALVRIGHQKIPRLKHGEEKNENYRKNNETYET